MPYKTRPRVVLYRRAATQTKSLNQFSPPETREDASPDQRVISHDQDASPAGEPLATKTGHDADRRAARAPHAPPLAAPRIVLDVDGPYLPLTERHRCADLVPDRQKDLRLELAHAAEAVVPRTNDGHGKDATEWHRLPPHLERHDGGVAPEHHVDRDGLLGDIGVEREPRAALRRRQAALPFAKAKGWN